MLARRRTANAQTDQEAKRARRQIQVGLLADAGETIASIAARLGVSRQTITDDLDAMGIDRPRPDRATTLTAAHVRREDLKSRWRDFPTMSAAARHYGISTSTIRDDYKALGIRPPNVCRRGHTLDDVSFESGGRRRRRSCRTCRAISNTQAKEAS